MKKLVFILAVVGLSASFTSCNRSWVCECSTSAGVVPIELNGVSKGDARKTCEKYALDQYAATGGCALR